MSHQEKQEIFDQYARSKGFDYWETLKDNLYNNSASSFQFIEDLDEHIFAACDLVQEEQQKRIAEKALVKFDYIGLNKTGATMSQKYFAGPGMRQYTADKDSIINPENKLKKLK